MIPTNLSPFRDLLGDFDRPDTLDAAMRGVDTVLLAAVQGGLLLAQAQHTTDALEAALDTVIAHISDHAAELARR